MSKARSAARLAAVQALYQLDMEKIPLARLLDEFHMHRFGEEIDDVRFAAADIAFFDDVVSGVDARLEEIDILLAANIGTNWKLERLDITLIQILRAGTFELMARADVPTSSVINEYVDVAHAFFDEKEAKFVNGLLDAVAKEKRA